jgi:hypothetical protein
VEVVQPEPHVPWDVDGSVLTIGSEEKTISIDLEEYQTDSETVMDIYGSPEGLGVCGKCGSYVLSVEIPPRKYREEEGEPYGGSGDGPSVVLVPEPLDIASVVLRLWTVESETTEDFNI